jgi:hypothetical protein
MNKEHSGLVYIAALIKLYHVVSSFSDVPLKCLKSEGGTLI